MADEIASDQEGTSWKPLTGLVLDNLYLRRVLVNPDVSKVNARECDPPRFAKFEMVFSLTV